MNNQYGYARVSSLDQNEDRQLLALEGVQINKEYSQIKCQERILIDQIINH